MEHYILFRVAFWIVLGAGLGMGVPICMLAAKLAAWTRARRSSVAKPKDRADAVSPVHESPDPAV